MWKRLGLIGSLFWLRSWIGTNSGTVDTWDYQLANLFFSKRLVCCCPIKELGKNIGYNEESTNTSEGSSNQKDVGFLTWPLKHPEAREVNSDADREVQKRCFQPSLRRVIYKKLFLRRC